MSMNKAYKLAGDDRNDVHREPIPPEIRTETDIKAALLDEIINARKADGLTQKQLEELSGVRQPVIARLEKGTTDPQLSTIIKVLTSIGRALTVVSLNDWKPTN